MSSSNGTATRNRRAKTDLDSVMARLRKSGWESTLSDDSYQKIAAAGLRSKNLPLAIVATQLAFEQKPITLRGLLYQVVSAGHLPSTDREHYTRLGRVMTALREYGTVPFSWIVDNVRSTEKPSSWSGLEDFADTVKRCYRKDFWAQLPTYVHVIVEKDAIAGVLTPVTREYDVALSPIRGYVSLSFAHDIADTWNRIDKPVVCYYLGDFDASGFDLERDVRAKLTRYCHREFDWERLGVNKEDFSHFDLIPLKPKKTDIAITDLTDAEAALMLASRDRVTELATWDSASLDGLLQQVTTTDGDITELLSQLAEEAGTKDVPTDGYGAQAGDGDCEYPLTPVPGEKYDYVLIFCDNESDFANLQTVLKVAPRRDYKSKAVAPGRVVRYREFRQVIEEIARNGTYGGDPVGGPGRPSAGGEGDQG